MKKYIIIFLTSTTLWALPSGSSVQSGGATVSTDSNRVTVSTTSDTNIINWTSFDLSTGESVEFSRTGVSQADTFYVFNQVMGTSATTVAGSIQGPENCHIYLCNPNGVVISSTGQVVSGGFFAAALTLSGTFAPNTDLTFTGSSGTVTHNGSINATGGDAILIGYRVVTNSGSTIEAAAGTATLGAGSDLLYRPAETDRIYVQTAGTAGTGTGIHHMGTITGGSVTMIADGSIYTLAINQANIIQATGCTSGANGQVRLIADTGSSRGAFEMTGSISRSCPTSGTGPSVEIYGYTVSLESTSSINVSGATGGNVTIGTSTTDYLTNNVNFESGATITSSGTTGNGGTVNFYAASSLLYYGTVTTTSTSGNGGNITANSAGYLYINGSANPSSTSGTTGTFTAQNNRELSVGTSTGPGTHFVPPNYTTTYSISEFTESSIEGILANGNVTVTTTDIDVTSTDINWTSGNTLNLTASDQIDIYKNLVMSGSGATGSVLILSAPVINIINSATGTVGADLASGNMSITASNILLLQGSSTGDAVLDTDSGDITIAFGNDVRLRGNGAEAKIEATNVTINAQTASTGDVSLQGGACGQANIVGATAVNIGSTTAVSDIEVIAGACGTGLSSAITGGTVNLTATDVTVQGGASGGGNIAYIRSLAGSSRDITITSATIDILAGAAGTNNSARILNSSTNGAINLTTTSDVTLTAGGSSTTASIAEIYANSNNFTIGGDLQLNGGGGTSSYAGIYGYAGTTANVTGNVELYSGSALYTHAKIESGTGDVSLTAGRSIYLYTGTSVHSDAFITTEGGTVALIASHDIRMRGDCNLPNKAYITTTGSGNVTLTASRDITRIGNTEINTGSLGAFSYSGNYSNTGCSASPIIVFSVPTATSQYYLYDYLYELFYRLRYFGVYDWYLFHSYDFWNRHTYTAP